MTNVLVVANQTATSQRLIDAVVSRSSQGECSFTLLVPVIPPKAGILPGMTSAATNVPHRAIAALDEYEIARQQMGAAIEGFRRAGVHVVGDVGDPDPVKAVADSLKHRQIDEIILSTLDRAVSRWLHQDVPSRIHRKFDLPVTVVSPEG
jgi:GABA permease